MADEIVDTFSFYDQKALFNRFENEYSGCKLTGFSLNPIIYAFQKVVSKYKIEEHIINSFLKSMRADLNKKIYTSDEEAREYIFGSAESVGLMCLKIFVQGDQEEYDKLEKYAKKLGSAFQKVNFLRDMKQDMEILDRCYFPGINRNNFDEFQKKKIINDIEEEFTEALVGIKLLPENSRLGVYTAYVYYSKLLEKIKKTPAPKLISKRIRISDLAKMGLLMQTFFTSKMGLM